MQISLVIPCYNEELNIQKGVLDKIGNFTKDNDLFREIIIVDDGSKDISKGIIREKYLPQFPKFRLVENNHQGKAYAVITGIEKARSSYVMFSDIDLATPLEESQKLVQEAENGYRIVIGSRNSHRYGAPFLRKLMAVGFIFFRNLLIGLKGIKDTQCGFKLFQRKAALDIISRLIVFKKGRHIQGSSVSAGFDLEFLFLATRMRYKIKEIHVAWKHVETKNVNFLKDTLETFQDIMLIKYYDIMHKYA